MWPAEHERARLREAVLRAVDVRLDDAAHVVDVAELDPRDQRDRADVPRRIEVVAVVLRELFGERARRARDAPLELAMRFGHRHVGGAQRAKLVGARPAAARNLADAGDRLSAQRGGERVGRCAASVRAGDQHEVGTVRADPSPERVRLGMLAIRDAGRRKLERCAFWIRDRHCEQIERAVSGAQLLVARDGGPHRGGCRVVAVEPADDQHRRRVRGAAGNGERVDPRAVACEADVERLGGQRRQSDPRNGDGECSHPPFTTVLRGLSIHGGSFT